MIEYKLATKDELPFILEVYNYHIINTTATFHLQTLNLLEMKASLPLEHDLYKTYSIYYQKKFCGYCYLNNWKPREAYRRSAEVTLYLSPEYHRKGIGQQTLIFLEQKAKELDIINLLGVITLENTASIKLFEKNGYVKVGHLRNIGKKFGRLLDVVTYQKELDYHNK